MKNLLLLVGVIGLGIGSWFIYKYLYPAAGAAAEKFNLILGGVFFVVALACLFAFFYQKFKEEGEQDISITKF
ncbi:MAG TPA: hypothetical protein VJZ26_00185 [Blastocatellia bacterium]|nr:hypothetical protein [Blastocatellia bacterium]